MKFQVSEVAKLLKVDRDVIKTWAYHLADYLNPLANPEKGKPRVFKASDLSVLSYISYYWEENPDIENIKYGLNAGGNSQYPFNEIVYSAVPFFMEPPEELEESWKHGSLRGSFGNYVDRFSRAQEFKLAADLLIETGIENNCVFEVFAPIVYNYRHATELYLKAIISIEYKDHNLEFLYNKLKSLLQEKYNAKIPAWFENLILYFHKFDPGGTSFRYEGEDPFGKEGELWVDVIILKKQMEWLDKSFSSIYNTKKNF